MKEFVEKLIERLEEEKEQYKRARGNTHCVITETSECDSCRADHYLYARLRCIDRTIEIVNQLAEEYNNDFCEWKIYGNGKHAVTSHGQVKYKYEVEDWCICPYCGKKIKVVE